jgi:NitT/TauT family transport system substrate-binding protein
MNPVRKSGRFPWQAGVALLSATALVTACGGDGDSGESGSGSDEAVAFSFAMGSSGAQGAFYQEAVERVNEKYGYAGEWVELTGSEVAVAGISSNEFQFGAGVAATVMAAQQEQDAEVTFIADFMRMLWTMTGKSDIEGCEDLDGVRFGLHSPGGVSTAIFNAWLAETCSDDVQPEVLYIEGSPNRLQGLLADQLDATMLEIDDTLDLPEDQFHIIVNFSEDLPEIEANTVFANNTFLEEHPEVVVNLLAEASALAAEVMEDPQVLADAIREYKPELADAADAIAEAYVEAELFVEDGAMSEEDLTATIELYEVAGAIDDGLTFDQIADRQYLDEALQQN